MKDELNSVYTKLHKKQVEVTLQIVKLEKKNLEIPLTSRQHEIIELGGYLRGIMESQKIVLSMRKTKELISADS